MTPRTGAGGLTARPWSSHLPCGYDAPAPLIGWAVGLGILAALAFPLTASGAERPAPTGAMSFPAESPSDDARKMAALVIGSGDHQGMPFLIVDKIGARVLAFDREGLLLGSAPALLGMAKGDDSPPGIGDRRLSTISPAERVTPAGRFVAALGENLDGKDILWVDYEAAISLHRVATGNAAERRLQRLASPSASDNRISYGCINVPVEFFETVVRPLFSGTVGVVYILPEARPLGQMLLALDAE